MIGGTPVLTRIAVMLYVLSVLSLVVFRRPNPGSVGAGERAFGVVDFD
jgi:hypothetical protein